MNLRFKRQLDSVVGNALVAVNLVAARTLGILLRRNHRLDPAPKKIAFIKILGLGSVLLAADSITAVRHKYPQARIVLICGRGVKPGVEPLGIFDEILEIRDHSFWAMLSSSLGILWKCWRSKGLWVADLEVYSKLTTIFSLWTCARNRFGYQLNTVRFRIRINTHNVYFNQFVHVEQNYGALVKAMGVDRVEALSFPGFPPPVKTGNETWIAINNTCSDLSRERKMPEVQLKQICEWLLANTSLKLAFTGAPSDFATIETFAKKHFPDQADRIRNIAGTLSFADYYQFLYSECRFMVTIDSAPLHIARRLHLPTLSLWGPTNPENLSAQNPKHRALYLRKHCSPCVHHTEVLPCGGDNVCMKDISMAQIETELKYLLSITAHSTVPIS